jgi:hypothetical protein
MDGKRAQSDIKCSKMAYGDIWSLETEKYGKH